MERKTKHRILGAFVVIGLVIISLPLFQGGKDLPSEATLVKAPPFPEQSMQVSNKELEQTEISDQQETSAPPAPVTVASNDDVKLQTDDTIDNDQPAKLDVQAPEIIKQEDNQQAKPTAAEATPTPMTEVDSATKSEPQIAENTNEKVGDSAKLATNVEETTVSKSPKDIWAEEVKTQVGHKKETPTVSDKIILEKKLETLVARKDVSDEIKPVKSIHTPPKAKKAIYITKPASAKVKHSTYTMAPLENNGLTRLKHPVWVIQIGSFKNKTNAVRLVNKVRAKGYSAFMQQVSTSVDSSTRVFVGPQLKQAEARALASQLENEMRIRGIVISFKPFVM